MSNNMFKSKPSTSGPTYPALQPGLTEVQKMLGYEPTGTATDWKSTGQDPIMAQFAQAIAGQKKALGMAEDLASGDLGRQTYQTAARDWREKMLPSMAARGLATSGPGINFETDQLRKMALEGQVSSATLLQQASQGLALLQSMPIELRQKFIALLLNPSTASTGGTPSLWEKLGAGPVKMDIKV